MKYVKGSCYCEKIKFKVALPVSWEGHCHCTQCQRLSGSAFVTWTGFKTNDFEIIDKENYFKIYNSGTADRGFCLNCGSSFYFKYNDNSDLELWTDYVYFTKTNIITELDSFPSKHIYYESHVKWIPLLDSLPKKEKTN